MGDVVDRWGMWWIADEGRREGERKEGVTETEGWGGTGIKVG